MGQKTISSSFNVNVVLDGNDGKNAVRLDLDNENDSMLYDGSGTPVSGNVTSKAYMFDGPDDVSNQTTFSIIGREGVTNAQATINTTTHVITVTGMNATTARVTVQGVYTSRGDTYKKTAVLTLKKIVDGDKYDLVITPNAIAYNATTDSPDETTLAIQVWKTSVNDSGGANRALATPPSVYGVYANGTKLTASSTGTYSYKTDNSAISEVLVKIANKASQSDILDAETIPVNKAENGAEGPGGATATVTPGELSVQCDKDGYVATAISGQALSFGLTVGGSTCSDVKAVQKGSLPNGVTLSTNSSGAVTAISISKTYTPSGGSATPVRDTMLLAGVSFTVSGTTADGRSVSSVCTLGLKGQRQGERGGDGPATPTYELIFDSYQASYNAQSTAFSLSAHVRVLKTEGTSSSYILSVDYTPEYKLSNADTWNPMTKTSSDFTCSVSAPSMSTAPVSVNFRLKNGSTVLCTAAMPITIKGEKGELGKMCYIAGMCKDGVEYKSNDQQTVAVEVQAASGSMEIYYLDGTSNKFTISGQTVYITPGNQDNYSAQYRVWKKGMNEENLIKTMYLFADFAKLGEGVVSGDWLFSAHGMICSTVINSDNPNYGGKAGYMYFDPAYANGIQPSAQAGTIGNSAVSLCSQITLNKGTHTLFVCGQRTAGSGNVRINLYRNGSSPVQKSIGSTSSTIVQFNITESSASATYTLTADVSVLGTTGKVTHIGGFTPNYAVDLLTGKTYQNDAYVKGQIVATDGEISGAMKITGTLTVGTYGSGNKSIRLNPSDSYGPGISGYNGTSRVFRLGFDPNENSKGYLALGDGYFREDIVWLTGGNGSATLVASDTPYMRITRNVSGNPYSLTISENNSGLAIIDAHGVAGASRTNAWPSRSQVLKYQVYIQTESDYDATLRVRLRD